MWTEITRPKYERSGRRYASDATDAEWSHIAPLLPAAKRGGRPRTTDLRDVFDAILYMASTGCQWRMLNGDNGRIAQKKAAERKSALLRGDQPSTGPAVPDHIREALDKGAVPGRVEAYIPASDPSEYKFQFNEAESFEAAQEMSHRGTGGSICRRCQC